MIATSDRLARRIAELERELAALRRQQRAEQDWHFLRVLARIVEDKPFVASDVVDACQLDPALADGIGDIASAPRRLGQRLATLATANGAGRGLRVERVRQSGHQGIWVLRIPRVEDAGRAD